ncbi:MAG: DUF3109 family protein [Alphaproteobacteria bacterium]|nr:DUF3109 family protein [Alphaproteobacteria bacterium]
MLALFERDPDYYRTKYAGAAVDTAAFLRRYSICDLKDCHGFCCHGGVSVPKKEEDIITETIAANASFFPEHGVALPNPPFEDWGVPGEQDTATRPFQYPIPIPEHFAHTSCVFRDDIGRCSLQMLSAERGKDSWHYKPLFCWLFPITITEGEDPLLITIMTEENDWDKSEDYPGFTTFTACGRPDPNGQPAFRILERELATLSKILGRNLIGEIMASENIKA